MYKNRFIFFLLLVFIPLLSLKAEKMRIAIMEFKAGKGVSKTLAKNVTDLVRTEIINAQKYIVLERNQIDKILKEQKFSKSGLTDEGFAVKLGKMLSAQKILIGTLMKIGSKIVINGRIIDVSKGVAEFGGKQTADTEDDLVTAVTLFCQKITGVIVETSSGYTIKTDKKIYSRKEAITVIFSNLPGNNHDMVSIAQISPIPKTYVWKKWTKRRKSGSIQCRKWFGRLKLKPGVYEARVHINWSKKNQKPSARYRFEVK